jgi:hypothetical protein
MARTRPFIIVGSVEDYGRLYETAQGCPLLTVAALGCEGECANSFDDDVDLMTRTSFGML